MGRYLILWEADESKIPINPEERKNGWLGAIEMVRQNMRDGTTKEYGCFIGQPKGFSLVEAPENEVANNLMKYIPYFRFKVFPVATIDELEETIRAIK